MKKKVLQEESTIKKTRRKHKEASTEGSIYGNKNVRKTLGNVQKYYFRKSAQKKEKSSKKAKEETLVEEKGTQRKIRVEECLKGSTEENDCGNKCTER